MLQPLLRRPQSSLRVAASIANGLRYRSLHSRPQLRYEREFEEQGIPGFMSPETFKTSWLDYQEFLVNKLNLLTEDSTFAKMDTLTLVKSYAKDRSMAPVFNYASMAHNNHFFFNGLSPTKVPIPNKLAQDMVDSGSSPESMKLDFLAAASAQFGGGFVWLVSQRKDGLLRILNTYNAGTPYSEAFARQQPVDMNTEPAKKAGGWYNPDSFSNQGVSANTAPGGNPITPLLCVNTWEHAWLYDYGFDGKDEYLERWWDRVDWNLVENAHKESPGYNGNMHSRTL